MALQTNIRPDGPNKQKKILDDLNLRKQLLKTGTVHALNSSSLCSPIGLPGLNSNPVSGENQLSGNARSTLQQANTTSFGYFVPQESNFGNYILAVLPRFNETK